MDQREAYGVLADRLLSYPQAINSKKLEGSQNMWRLRVEDWRVIPRLDREQGILYVLRIRHTREALTGRRRTIQKNAPEKRDANGQKTTK